MPTGQYLRKPHTKERTKNISLALKGRKVSESHRRKIAERMRGKTHPRYKGDKATKNVIHRWVEKRKPKPERCKWCNEKRKLGLANLKNHNYTRDINDYEWLCYSCHSNYDKNKEICKKGHKLEGYNLTISKRGARVCRECGRIANKRYRDKKKGEELVE